MLTLLKQTLFPWRVGRSKERRGERRYQVTYRSTLLVNGESSEVALEDVTPGGARLRSGRKLQVGQVVLVTFPCGPRQAVCRWIQSREHDWSVGLQFTASSDPS